jgi:hypothetical protein
VVYFTDWQEKKSLKPKNICFDSATGLIAENEIIIHQ